MAEQAGAAVPDAEALEASVMGKYKTQTAVTRDSNTLELTNPSPEKVGMLTDLDVWDIDLSQYGEGYFAWAERMTLSPYGKFFFHKLKPQIEKLKVNKDRKSRQELVTIQSSEGSRFDMQTWLRMMMEDKGKKDS